MSLWLTNLSVDLNTSDESIFEMARKKLRVSPSDIRSIQIYKRSLDARKRTQIHFVVSLKIALSIDEEQVVARYRGKDLRYQQEVAYQIPTVSMHQRPIIVGFGPAGMFSAYILAKAGCCPIVLERGDSIENRVASIERFWNQRTLDPNSNVQFGEGGAGTFSDGKLTTRISDPRCDFVLSTFVAFGAPEEILYKAKPHIGTDKLRAVLVAMRKEIERLGGTVLFRHQMDNLIANNGVLQGIEVNGDVMPTTQLVLAVGHSARDTFSMLHQSGLTMLPKSFSVGARIEHLQSRIDEGLYGDLAGHPKLPQGEYQLSYRQNGRGVYTFCMCPGGVVVPSSSSEGTVVVNGMSEFARDGKNANSAVVVSVDPKDFGSHPLDGVRFQEKIEQAAYQYGGGGYTAPAVTVKQFLDGDAKLKLGAVIPSYALGVQAVDFDHILPSYVTDMMRIGLQSFGRKLPGFDADDAVLTGAETRTSSPVRILRNELLYADQLRGVYPCGEGAGYAGGIMSAAVDGMKVAEQILKTVDANLLFHAE